MHRGGRTAAPTLWTRKNPRNRTVPGISRLWVKNSVKRNPFQPFFRIKKYKKIYPAFRFERTHLQQGTRTAKSLYGFLEMSRTTDQCTTIDADANEETNADTFASYVRASKKCPSCGRPKKLIKSKRGKFFLPAQVIPLAVKRCPLTST